MTWLYRHSIHTVYNIVVTETKNSSQHVELLSTCGSRHLDTACVCDQVQWLLYHATIYSTASMLFIVHREAFKDKTLSRILVLRIVTGQLCYRGYSYPYTLVLMKRSHHCLFCPSRACEGCSGKKITPQLLNEAFLEKATQLKSWKRHKQPYETSFETYKGGMQLLTW